MKKVISILAITMMIGGLVGCMDDPDGSKQKGYNESSSLSSIN